MIKKQSTPRSFFRNCEYTGDKKSFNIGGKKKFMSPGQKGAVIRIEGETQQYWIRNSDKAVFHIDEDTKAMMHFEHHWRLVRNS